MMNLKKHSNLETKISMFLIAAALLSGCGKEPRQNNYVARVNDSYLTKDEFARLVDTNSVNNFYKNEVIRNWINRELLFQKAVTEGITEGDEFKRLIKDSKKELAASLLLDKELSKRIVNYKQRDLLNFFGEHKDEFKLNSNSYLLNQISFSDADKAVEFRSLLLDSEWKKAVALFENDSTLLEIKTKVFLKEEDIHPAVVARIVKRLYPPQISIVISGSEGYYTVVQLLGKYLKKSVPPFQVIKADVEKRFLAEKRKELMEKFINDLYSNNDIEVKN